jgi:hypothetical protein
MCHRPYSLRRRLRRPFFFSPSQKRGDGAPSGAPVFRLAASRRSIAAISVSRAAFPGLRSDFFSRPQRQFGSSPCRALACQKSGGTLPVQRSSSRGERPLSSSGSLDNVNVCIPCAEECLSPLRRGPVDRRIRGTFIAISRLGLAQRGVRRRWY